MRLDHILSGKHNDLIFSEWEREHRRVNGRKLANHYKRIKESPLYRMTCSLRARLGAALRARKAVKSSVGLVGCTPAALRGHIEAQFTPGMTWANYGLWHVDHIRPCASFDLLDPEQQRKCFHYTNLQPLWGSDNFKKGSKVTL